MEANVGKLMTLKKVKFASANGTNVWAPDDTNTSLELIDAETGKKISSSNLVVRNSGYSKFANEVVPQGVFDITGIFTRYNNRGSIYLWTFGSWHECGVEQTSGCQGGLWRLGKVGLETLDKRKW